MRSLLPVAPLSLALLTLSCAQVADVSDEHGPSTSPPNGGEEAATSAPGSTDRAAAPGRGRHDRALASSSASFAETRGSAPAAPATPSLPTVDATEFVDIGIGAEAGRLGYASGMLYVIGVALCGDGCSTNGLFAISESTGAVSTLVPFDFGVRGVRSGVKVASFDVNAHLVYQTSDGHARLVRGGTTQSIELPASPGCIAMTSSAARAFCRSEEGQLLAWEIDGEAIAPPTLLASGLPKRSESLADLGLATDDAIVFADGPLRSASIYRFAFDGAPAATPTVAQAAVDWPIHLVTTAAHAVWSEYDGNAYQTYAASLAGGARTWLGGGSMPSSARIPGQDAVYVAYGWNSPWGSERLQIGRVDLATGLKTPLAVPTTPVPVSASYLAVSPTWVYFTSLYGRSVHRLPR